MTIGLDSDRALNDETEDRFGFVGMAKRLSPSIIASSKGDGSQKHNGRLTGPLGKRRRVGS